MICKVCLADKPEVEFRHTKSGSKSYACRTCKACEWQKEKDRRLTNPERVASLKASYIRNKAKIYANKRAAYLANVEEERRKDREYYSANKDHVGRVKSEWRKKHRVANVTYAHRYRVKARSSKGRHTSAEWLALCDKYDNVCLCCGLRVMLTRDHILPVVSDGDNSINNIQPLCGTCNSRKRDKHIDYRPECEYRGIELSMRVGKANGSVGI